MYFPYFRGRQYELLALRELASNKLITNSVIPVVEPIKVIPALTNALAAFQVSSLPIGLILNPSVGDLKNEREIILNVLEQFNSNSSIIPSVLLNNNSSKTLNELEQHGINRESVLTVLNKQDYIDTYQSLFSSPPSYTLCPYDRLIRRAVKHNSVIFENKFHKQNRNADYPPEEAFSSDHLDYGMDDYIGFGDYSIIGDDYIESGFAPYAVAIHIVYFANDESLRIKHFISDSNEDISDVAGKFYQAVTKLHSWFVNSKQEQQLTRGLQTLLDHYQNKTYPGLPTLKKLSIMHHLELMCRYLDGRYRS